MMVSGGRGAGAGAGAGGAGGTAANRLDVLRKSGSSSHRKKYDEKMPPSHVIPLTIDDRKRRKNIRIAHSRIQNQHGITYHHECLTVTPRDFRVQISSTWMHPKAIDSEKIDVLLCIALKVQEQPLSDHTSSRSSSTTQNNMTYLYHVPKQLWHQYWFSKLRQGVSVPGRLQKTTKDDLKRITDAIVQGLNFKLNKTGDLCVDGRTNICLHIWKNVVTTSSFSATTTTITGKSDVEVSNDGSTKDKNMPAHGGEQKEGGDNDDGTNNGGNGSVLPFPMLATEKDTPLHRTRWQEMCAVAAPRDSLSVQRCWKALEKASYNVDDGLRRYFDGGNDCVDISAEYDDMPALVGEDDDDYMWTQHVQ